MASMCWTSITARRSAWRYGSMPPRAAPPSISLARPASCRTISMRRRPCAWRPCCMYFAPWSMTISRSMLNPQYPASVVSGNVETSTCITNALYGALGAMAASQGTMNNFTFGNAQYQYYETISGGSGAGPGFNGTDVVQTNMTNSRLTDPEILEWRFPVRLDSYAIRAGSGGAGLWCGGNGGVRRVRFLQAMTAAILSNNRMIPPFGMDGGEPGALGRNTVERVDGTVERLPHIGKTQMQPGDVFVIETPGGGGYGQDWVA